MEAWREELYHHGILGMKWGKRNGPPYPLGASDHSASEKKAGWRKSLDNGGNNSGALKQGAENNNKSLSAHNNKISSKEISDYRKEMIKKAKYDPSKQKKYRRMSESEIRQEIERRQKIKKTILVASATVGTAAAIYIAYKAGALDRIIKSGQIDGAALEQVSKDALEDVAVVLDKGSIIHRMSGYNTFDISKAGEHMYVSYKKRDVDAYKSILKDWSGTGKRFDIELKVTNKVVAPTEERTRKIVEDLFQKDGKFMDALAKTTAEFQRSQTRDKDTFDRLVRWEYGKSLEEHIKDEFQAYSKDQLFRQAMWSIVRDSDASKMIKSEVSKQGYTAIIDLFDAGDLAETPLILLNPKNLVVLKGMHEVSKYEKLAAIKRLSKAASHPASQYAKQMLAMAFG